MDNYEKIRTIGKGNFGRVYLAREKSSGRRFAIKQVSMRKSSKREKKEAIQEVAVMCQVRHPHIISYVESFADDTHVYIVMEYAEEGDLKKKIKDTTAMPERQVCHYFLQICLALKHLHDLNVLHRDLKSENVFLLADDVIKIGDFGVAKVLKGQYAFTQAGTPHYLSPEIAKGAPYDTKADMWSLGVCLYELASGGEMPFQTKGGLPSLIKTICTKDYTPLSKHYSHDLRSLVRKLLNKDPRKRPSIDDVLRAKPMRRAFKALSAGERALYDKSGSLIRDDDENKRTAKRAKKEVLHLRRQVLEGASTKGASGSTRGSSSSNKKAVRKATGRAAKAKGKGRASPSPDRMGQSTRRLLYGKNGRTIHHNEDDSGTGTVSGDSSYSTAYSDSYSYSYSYSSSAW